MGYDDDDRDETLQQISERLDTLERENASLKEQVKTRPAAASPLLTSERWETIQQQARETARKAADETWKQTGSRDASQRAYVETLEETAGRAGGE